MILAEAEIIRRKPVWAALSDLWLDTELDDRDLSYIAGVMCESGYGLDELRRIYLYEVAPVVYGNMLTVAGVWGGFDEAWLHEEIVQALSTRTGFGNWWLGRMRWLMTYATEAHWNTLAAKVEALRRDTDGG